MDAGVRPASFKDWCMVHSISRIWKTSLVLPLLTLSCALDWNTAADGTTDSPYTIVESIESMDFEDDCPAGLILCFGECVDVASSHSHCGGCGRECESYEVCNDGLCSLECPPGKVACGGGCVDIQTDISNCGSCGNVCTAGEHADPVCDNGVCTIICHEGWADVDGDSLSCEADCVPVSTMESCNGVDDNCDGNIDEGFACRMGQDVACTTTCGSAGTGVCGIDCMPPSAASCNPPDEMCNGGDDDCDGACDNGFDCCIGDSDTCSTPCGSPGTRTCTATCGWSDCHPDDEACNGEDDDCDGECDNGAGMACCAGEEDTCTSSCGGEGTRTCSSSCVWDTCLPPAETCDGEDEDCDTVIDNGFEDSYESSGGNTCGSAVNVGNVSDSSRDTITINANILGPGDEDWFRVMAMDDSDSTSDEFNFEVYWETNPGGLSFDVYEGSCSSSWCSGITDCANWYTDFYVGGEGENPCRSPVQADYNTCDDDSQTFLIRVYRSSGSGLCSDYSIKIRNNPASPGPGCSHR